MQTRRKLVGGNWKMNGSLDSVSALTEGIVRKRDLVTCEVVVFPPAVYLAQVRLIQRSLNFPLLGAQNVNSVGRGAFTGEISTAMLTDFSCSYALVGHSERRKLYGESDLMVAEKFAACIASGIQPVLCVGETLEERESGKTGQVVDRQLRAVLTQCGIASFDRSVIAYEPVWAIGTGVSAEPEQAQEVHSMIRDVLISEDATIGQRVRIIYGGSVTPANASDLFARNNIDGALVGGASLDPDGFMEICRLAS